MSNILIIGTGAIAKFLGASIKDSKISFLGNHIGESFVFYQNCESHIITDYQIISNTDFKSVPNDFFDVIFWATSTVFNDKILEEYKHWFIGYKGTVLNFQNGIGYENTFKKYLPLATLYFGITNQAVLKMEEGIMDTGKGDFFLPFESFAIINSLGLNKQLNINFPQSIKTLRLQKLSVNVIINPITTLLQIRNGDLFDNVQSKPWVEKIISETISYWIQEEVYKTEAEYYKILKEISQSTAKNKSSMYQSFLNHLPLELEAILLPVIQKTQSPTLISLLKDLEVIYSKNV
jgi:2-dehydropantoate 2-reductase